VEPSRDGFLLKATQVHPDASQDFIRVAGGSKALPPGGRKVNPDVTDDKPKADWRPSSQGTAIPASQQASLLSYEAFFAEADSTLRGVKAQCYEARAPNPLQRATSIGHADVQAPFLPQYMALDKKIKLLPAQESPDTVILNVYDLTNSGFVGGFNRLASVLGTGGAFHVGLQVWSEEWSFGQSDSGTGVMKKTPRKDGRHAYKMSVPLGSCKLHYTQLRRLLAEMEKDWTGDSYHILHRNCCHFAAELLTRLGARAMPDWVCSFNQSVEHFVAPFEGLFAQSPTGAPAISRKDLFGPNPAMSRQRNFQEVDAVRWV